MYYLELGLIVVLALIVISLTVYLFFVEKEDKEEYDFRRAEKYYREFYSKAKNEFLD